MTSPLELERYVSLTTFRRDGTPVATPVWVSGDPQGLFVWTEGASGKVKRIRNDPHVTLAPCDARGRATGEAVEARAVVLDEVGTVHVVTLLKAKYGWQFAFFGVVARLTGRGGSKNVGLRVELETPTDAG